MNRVPNQAYAEVIGEALSVIPDRIRERLSGVHFVCGVDPAFVGLHQYDKTSVGDSRPYSETAHCCYWWNLNRPASDRPTTIVLPKLPAPWVVVHELGHALDYVTGFNHRAAPVTDYARTNRMEAFAEAFTAWRFWGYGDEDTLWSDGATLALFDEVAA